MLWNRTPQTEADPTRKCCVALWDVVESVHNGPITDLFGEIKTNKPNRISTLLFITSRWLSGPQTYDSGQLELSQCVGECETLFETSGIEEGLARGRRLSRRNQLIHAGIA
jgi:hypothetical protein